LAQSEAGLRIIFEHAQQAMAIVRPDGTVQAMNRAGRALLPADTDPVGRPFADLPFWSSDREATTRLLAEAVATCLGGSVYRTTARATLPDGRIANLDFSLWPVRSDDTVFAIIAEARDLPDAGA